MCYFASSRLSYVVNIHSSACLVTHSLPCKEYEVVASTASAEDCGSGGGVAVKHGIAGKGPVVGLVQVRMVDEDNNVEKTVTLSAFSHRLRRITMHARSRPITQGELSFQAATLQSLKSLIEEV